MQYRVNLFPRDSEFLHDFFHSRASLKILKYRSHRQPGVSNTHAPLTFPGILSTAGHWDQSRIAIFAPPFIVAGYVVFYHGRSQRHTYHFPKNFPTPTRTSTVLIPGLGSLNPAFEICKYRSSKLKACLSPSTCIPNAAEGVKFTPDVPVGT